jgi:hypothetical protein
MRVVRRGDDHPLGIPLLEERRQFAVMDASATFRQSLGFRTRVDNACQPAAWFVDNVLNVPVPDQPGADDRYPDRGIIRAQRMFLP